MNISEDRKVVLEPYREVPKEVLFTTRDDKNCIRDQYVRNRYWFNFPEQWANQLDKEAIIGIRSMYITKRSAPVVYDYSIVVKEYNTDKIYFSLTGRMFTWVGANDHLLKILSEFNERWYTDYIIIDTDEFDPEVFKYCTKHKFIEACYVYEFGYCQFSFGIPPYMNKVYQFKRPSTGEIITAQPFIYITPVSTDCKAIFGFDTQREGETCVRFPVWSRHQCYITSSLATEAYEGYLGHTRTEPYSPIKYFRLTSNHKKFWIELWETRNRDCAAELPKDDKDILNIEAILCFSSSAML